jgi:hypothetical protein
MYPANVRQPEATASFAGKAKEWEDQRIRIATESRMKKYREEVAAKQAAEDALLVRHKGFAKKATVAPAPQAEVNEEKFVSEWTVVRRKVHKKKEFNYYDEED